MSILISDLVKTNKLKLDSFSIHNEKAFDFFSRISKEVNGKKCVFVLDKKYLKKLDESVVMIITNKEIYNEYEKLENIGFCVADNPRGLYFTLLEVYENQIREEYTKTHFGKNCDIAKTAIISENGVSIGNNVFIGDNVIIKRNVIIGDNVKIQSGTVIGDEDFNVYNYQGQNKQLKHNGTVIIGNNVLIGVNCYIGQALYSYGKTIIENDVQIGSVVCIGHNAIVSQNCEICGGSIVGGYTKVGQKTFIGMRSVLKNALEIGENASIGMGSVVVRNIKAGTKVFGNPAMSI